MRAAAIAVAMLAMPALATAAPRKPLPPVKPSPPDRGAAAMAGEGNLEWPRSGFRAAFALGPSMQVGMGIEESSGPGGGLSIRVGTASGPRLAWTLEASGAGFLQRDGREDPKLNNNSLLAIGAQVHLTEALWVRFGGGLASFTSRSEDRADPLNGVGGVVGAGFDAVRRGNWALALELTVISAVYGDGAVTSSILGLGVAYY